MIATILLILGEIWRGIWRAVLAIYDLLHKSPVARIIAAALLGAVLVLVIFMARACKSTTDPLDPVIIETGQNVNHAVNQLERVNSNVRDAEANTNKARENLNKIRTEKNTPYIEANRNRCIAYPEDCQK